MKNTLRRRLALLACLFILASVVFATGVQTAQATLANTGGGGAGTGSVTTPSQPQSATAADVRAHDQGMVVPASAVAALITPQGRGGFDAAHFTPPQAAQSGSSGSSSRTAWIAGGSAAAALIVIIGTLALVRSRRQPSGRPSAAYCAQHPEDPVCATA